MSTKIFLRAVACSLVVFLFGTLIYAVWLARAKRVEMDGLFYFLVSEEEHVEACAELVKLDGGAGYLLREGDTEYVAFSVYERQADCERVCNRLQSQGERAKTVEIGVKSLLFKGKQRQNADMYLGALRTLKSYVFLLGDCIARLEEQCTQEGCKRLLEILQRQLRHAGKLYESYEEYARVCEQSAEELGKLTQAIVYAKDLRYLRCWQAERYVRLCEQFS